MVEKSGSLVFAESRPAQAFVPQVSSAQSLPVPEEYVRLLSGSDLSWITHLHQNCGRTMGYTDDHTQDDGGALRSFPLNDPGDFAAYPPCERHSNTTPVLCQGLGKVVCLSDAETAPESADAELEVDMEWYSSLGHFISTPQNDFAI